MSSDPATPCLNSAADSARAFNSFSSPTAWPAPTSNTASGSTYPSFPHPSPVSLRPQPRPRFLPTRPFPSHCASPALPWSTLCSTIHAPTEPSPSCESNSPAASRRTPCTTKTFRSSTTPFRLSASAATYSSTLSASSLPMGRAIRNPTTSPSPARDSLVIIHSFQCSSFIIHRSSFIICYNPPHAPQPQTPRRHCGCRRGRHPLRRLQQH